MTGEFDHQFDRRRFLTRGAAVASGMVLGAGALEVGMGSAGAVRTNGSGRNGISTAKPKRGGSLTIGVNAEEQGFDPTSARFDQPGFMYARTVFDPLAMITSTGTVVPYLAQSITPNADFTQWTVTLRPNLTFHDGTPCDGAALLQNFEAQLKSALTGVALRPLIASFTQSGPLTVQINMKHAWVQFPTSLAEAQTAYIAAPSMLNASNGTSNPVGTGPFKFKEWIPNDHFTATANPNYWRKGLPYLSSVTFRPIPDANARAQALQSGTVDMIHVVEPQQMLVFRGNRSYAYADNSGKMVGSPDVNCLMLNVSKPPFNDIDARRALAMASNRNQYAKVIDQNVNAPATGLYQPGSPYFSKTSFPGYNLSGAKKLVKNIEQKTGKPFTFTLNAVGTPYTERIAQYTQQIFQQAGIKMSIKTILQNDLINEALAGTFEATEWRQFGGMSPDQNYVWFSPTTVSPSGISINMARNSDPRIEKAMLSGMESPTDSVRIKSFQQVNEYLAQDVPYIWTDRSTWALVSKPNVNNWNNPMAPNGTKGLGNDQGVWWITQAWRS